MLPHESHSQRARESVPHVLQETSGWLDRYTKNPQSEWKRGYLARLAP